MIMYLKTSRCVVYFKSTLLKKMMVCLYFPRGAGDVYRVGEFLKILLVQIWVEVDLGEKLEVFC